MVQVESPPVAPSSPARDPVAPWPAVVATAFLVDALVPWERWCDGGTAHFAQRCFTAHVWSGSASLLGSLAIVLALVFLVATIRRGVWSVPGAGRLAAFAGFLTAATAKSVITIANGGTTTSANPVPSPAWIGLWAGLCVAAVGWILLVSAIAPRMHRRRAIAAVIAVAVLVGGLGVPYARSGLAWWGGPLAQPEYLGGGNGLGMTLRPGQVGLFYGLLFLGNAGRETATFDGLDIVDASAPIEVLGTFVLERGPCSIDDVDVPGLPAGECAYRLPDRRIAPGGPEDHVDLAMLIRVPAEGVYRSGWFRVRYHVGPLRFQVFRTDELVVCAPEPGKRRCPGGAL